MAKKRITLPVFIASLLIACIATFQITAVVVSSSMRDSRTVEVNYGQGSAQEPDSETVDNSAFLDKAMKKLTELDTQFRKLYIGEIDDDELIYGILSGYVYSTGDDYAEYYDPEDYEQFMNDLSGEGEGLGINVIYNADYDCIEVLNIFPDSPASGSDLRVGDLIVYVGEEKEKVSDLGYYGAISKLRGKSGTEAIFTVARGDDRTEQVEIRVTRGPFTEVNVFSRVYSLDETIGVVKISGFNGQTPSQFRSAVRDLLDSGCEKLILDVRNNPGGELMSIVRTLDYLLPEGPIIRIYDKNDDLVDQYDSDASCVDVPMAVLTNHSTASAAELFTAALRDYEMATVIGTTTYGKGCMQTTTELPSGGALSVTYRMFKPPFSESYHGVGIVPDIEVELDEEFQDINLNKITDEQDNQLKAAAEALGGN